MNKKEEQEVIDQLRKDILKSRSQENKLQYWLNNLHENKVIYRERFIILAELENMKFANDIFLAQIKPLKMIYLPRFFRNKEEKTEQVLNSSWEIGFRLTPIALTLEDQTQKINTYSSFTIWTEPSLVQKVELLVENGKLQEATNLINL